MRHAWLIIAHNEFGILQRLVSALDSPQSEIYIHIDKKVESLPDIHVKRSRLIFLSDRIDVRWGSILQIKCELVLLKTAFASGPYDYYHIISGTTLPLKSFEEIDLYFHQYRGKSVFRSLCQPPSSQEILKVRRYNLFVRHYASPKAFLRKSSQFLWKASVAIQRLLGIEANQGKVFYNASNWVSLTQDAVKYILGRERDILKTYRYSFCGDEYFIPSELMGSPLKDALINGDHYLLHKIIHSNASVYPLTEYNRLSESGYLFARKFTER